MSDTISADDLVDGLLAAATPHTALHDKVMQGFSFQGKSLQDWLDDMSVNIPDKMNPEEYRQVAALLARKLQKAMYFYTMTSTTNGVLAGTTDNRKSGVVADLVAGYAAKDAKRPAAGVLEHMADNRLQEVHSHTLASRLLRDFWRDRRDALIESRKLLETIGMSSNMELKYLEASQVN